MFRAESNMNRKNILSRFSLNQQTHKFIIESNAKEQQHGFVYLAFITRENQRKTAWKARRDYRCVDNESNSVEMCTRY